MSFLVNLLHGYCILGDRRLSSCVHQGLCHEGSPSDESHEDRAVQVDGGSHEGLPRTKEAVQSAPVVQPWCHSALTRVITDASDVGIGAALMQMGDNQWHVVEYFSRKLTDTERRYCATDKEFLAINEAVTKHWRHRLLDRNLRYLRTTIPSPET